MNRIKQLFLVPISALFLVAMFATPVILVNSVGAVANKAVAYISLGEGWEAYNTHYLGCSPVGCIVGSNDGQYALGGVFGFTVL
jgi:hypothetical protein